jgi:hypothetical protein
MSEIEAKLDAILEVDIAEEDEIIEPEIVADSPVVVAVPAQLPAVIPDVPEKRDLEYDYEYSRTLHRDLLEQGQEALPDLLKVAKESQHPRAYEVAAGFLKTLSDMTDKLMVLHNVKKKLDGEDGGPRPTTTNNIDKAVFVGSTAELLKQIKNEPTV